MTDEAERKPDTKWHSMDAAEAVKKLESDHEKGLSADEVQRRLELFGRSTSSVNYPAKNGNMVHAYSVCV
ncbi:MAG: hypothetical protein LC662_00820 [Rhodothermaceae bacterium]|nr:hypothetical protein [Rhodothermaceae bacterium]